LVSDYNSLFAYKLNNGTSQAVNDGDVVLSATDQSPTNALAALTSGNNPTLRIRGPANVKGIEWRNGDGASTVPFPITGGASISRQNFAIFAAVRNARIANNNTSGILGASSNGLFFQGYGVVNDAAHPGTLRLYSVSQGSFPGATCVPILTMPSGPQVVGIVGTASGITFYNGNKTGTAAAFPSGNVTIDTLCGEAGTNFAANHQLIRQVAYNTAPSAGTIAQIIAYLQYVSGAPTAPTRRVVCVGDSITNGWSGASIILDSWSAIAVWNGNLASTDTVNYGVAGQTAATIATNIAAYSPLFSSGLYTDQWAVVFAGINDIKGGATSAAIQTSLTTICGSLVTAGFKVCLVVITAAGDFTGAQTTVYNTLVAWIRSSGVSVGGATIIADVAANPNLIPVGNIANPTDFFDQTHYNNTGSAAAASTIGAAITTHDGY
jgi:lysophospholipase L1-like esterase